MEFSHEYEKNRRCHCIISGTVKHVHKIVPREHSEHCLSETSFNFVDNYKNVLVIVICFQKVVFCIFRIPEMNARVSNNSLFKFRGSKNLLLTSRKWERNKYRIDSSGFVSDKLMLSIGKVPFENFGRLGGFSWFLPLQKDMKASKILMFPFVLSV